MVTLISYAEIGVHGLFSSPFRCLHDRVLEHFQTLPRTSIDGVQAQWQLQVREQRAGKFKAELASNTALLVLQREWPGLEHLIELLIVKSASNLRFIHASCVAVLLQPFVAADAWRKSQRLGSVRQTEGRVSTPRPTRRGSHRQDGKDHHTARRNSGTGSNWFTELSKA